MLNGYKFACVLAARAHSRRLKNKNLRKCAGKPLWLWTKEAVDSAHIFNDKYVTTDLETLYRTFIVGNWIWSTRPEHLAGSNVHISDVMRWMAQRDYIDHEYLCLVSPTNPLRTGDHIRDAAKLMLKEKADAVVAVAPCHPRQQNLLLAPSKEICPVHLGACGKQTRDFHQCYHLTGSIVIAKTELWARKASIYDDPNIKTIGYVMPKYDVDIDTKEDLFAAEAIIEWQRKRRTSLRSSIKSAIQERFHRKSKG